MLVTMARLVDILSIKIEMSLQQPLKATRLTTFDLPRKRPNGFIWIKFYLGAHSIFFHTDHYSPSSL